MSRYILQRIIMGIVTLLIVATVTFALMHAVPGDPLRQEKAVSEVVRRNLEIRYGLDRPLLDQYLVYMENMFIHGDFGISFKQQNRTVNDIIKEHFAPSAILGIFALLGALLVGVSLGVTAALKRNSLPDGIAMMIAVLGVSIPSFCLAYFLQHIFALWLGVLPVGGWDGAFSAILPAMSLGMIVMASMARLMRSSMLEVVQQDYIKTAKAKGLSKLQIILRHQIRNALLPVMVYFGPLFAAITTGSFVIESIFGIPGLGQFFVSAVNELDYTVIMGLTVFYAGFSISMILLNDLVLAVIDPRIRLAG
jgi:ABC-type dipeptide/oligopeptide/nickel transport system permease component